MKAASEAEIAAEVDHTLLQTYAAPARHKKPAWPRNCSGRQKFVRIANRLLLRCSRKYAWAKPFQLKLDDETTREVGLAGLLYDFGKVTDKE